MPILKMKYNIIEEQLERLKLHKICNIEEALQERFGADKAEEIVLTWNRLADEADKSDEPGRQDKLYEYLHSDSELSMIVTCYTDADIIRNICRWLNDHTDYFGQHILDVGCGTGIISCMLAMMLPKAHIMAIDRSPECIKIANEVKERLGIANIQFENMSVEDVPPADTVFSSRTFHENIGIRYTDNVFLPFSRQVEAYGLIYREYCMKLASLIRPGGTLVCIERNHMDTEYYSVLKNFAGCGMKIIAGSLNELQCEESDFAAKSVFQTFAFEKPARDKSMELESFRRQCGEVTAENGSNADVFGIWQERAFANNTETYMFTRPQADWFVEQNADGNISGFETFAENGMQVARMSLLRIRGDNENFILHQTTVDQTGVQILPLTVLSDVQNALLSRKTADQAMGYVVTDMTD